MEIEVTRSVLDCLLAEAAKAHPQECCGLLLGNGTHIVAILPTANVHPQPENHFEIDPQALIDAHRAARTGGPQIAGYYHSHPNGLQKPSATDAKMASGDGKIWAIIATSQVNFWEDSEEGFCALSYGSTNQ